jgi:hypothetical protein
MRLTQQGRGEMTRTATFVPAPPRRPARRTGRPTATPVARNAAAPAAEAAIPAPDDVRRRLGADLAERLWSAEQAVDAALGEAAALIALLPQARRQAALAATVAQPAFSAAADSVAALAKARGDLVEAHRTLAALARRLGLDALAAGPMDKPKDDRPGPGYGGG